jgi:hypothetical protein
MYVDISEITNFSPEWVRKLLFHEIQKYFEIRIYFATLSKFCGILQQYFGKISSGSGMKKYSDLGSRIRSTATYS